MSVLSKVKIPTPLRLGPKPLALATVSLLCVLAMMFYLGYRLGAPAVAGIAATRGMAAEDVSALAVRLGQLQAKVIRLDALGRRLVERAGLDPKEFDFDHPPGQGGPDLSAVYPSRPPSRQEFMQSLDNFGHRLEAREQQLGALESVVLNRDLQHKIYPSGHPVDGGFVSSEYGPRTDPFTGEVTFHSGVDLAGRDGDPVKAAAAGVVVLSGEHEGYGNVVEINHGNGYVTRYAHNARNIAAVGQRVDKNQTIALMGSTGRSTGPHVHFEVLYNGQTVNPARYLSAAR